MISPRVSYYSASGQAHWPDAYIGSDEYYAIDWDKALIPEGDSISGFAMWSVPPGLTASSETTILNKAQLKLLALLPGDHVITCTINTTKSQILVQKINLTVV